MLTQSKGFEKRVKLNVTNSIQLHDEITDEQNGKGRKFVSRFIEPGVVTYKEFGDVLITKETLDKFINTMVGCPVIINHKDINKDNVEKERVGVVSNVWYNESDGWYYCDGILFDKDAIDLVKKKGWNVSCSYDFVSDFESKTHNGKKLDAEFTDGNFLHLALVDNPRYERANIVVNSADNWLEPENIDYWFSTKTGVKIPVAKDQTKEQALKNFVTEKTKQRIKRDKKKNEAIDILYHVVGKDLNYTKADLKRNIKRESVGEKISEIIEKNHDRLTDLHYSGEYYTTGPFTYGKFHDDNTIEQQNFLNKLFDDIVTDNTQTDFEERLNNYYDNLYSDIDAKVDDVISEYMASDYNISEVTLAEQLSNIYGISKEDILNNGEIWKEFYSKIGQKANNSTERKENIVMTALNELEKFVRNIVENACKNEEKEEMKVENADKRKLIDEVAGMMKSAGCDDEVIRTAIAKMEKIGYEKSEAGSADNKCKNADEEEKEEKFEEEKEIAENKKAKNEEEKIELEEEVENKNHKAENSMDEENTMDKAKNMVYNGNSEVKSSYISRVDRLELGNNY